MASKTNPPAPEPEDVPQPDEVDRLLERRAPLAAKIAYVAGAAARLPKTKEVSGQGPKFSYTPVEDMAHAVTDLCARLGIAMVPREVHPLAWGPQRQDGVLWAPDGRKSLWVYRVLWEVTDGETSLEVTTMGEAADWGDKGSNKALTSARKYLYMMLFHLETGDDPDAVHGAVDPQQGAAPKAKAEPAPKAEQVSPEEVTRRKERVVAEFSGDADLALAWLRDHCDCRTFGALRYPKVWAVVEDRLKAAIVAPQEGSEGESPGGSSNAATQPQAAPDVDERARDDRYARVVAKVPEVEKAHALMRGAGAEAKSDLANNAIWAKVAAAVGIDSGLPR